ncbi:MULTISPECIES: STAS domain-containing protein [Acidiphilium]|jgi:chemotaxis protein CheX|uniref:STAS domain-containing protein n=1 Tax=Acidiphilium TaxID=522 RepID=UPI000970AD4A|nr:MULTISPECIES: STAS domain-containing protein [Acidiphilium]MBW4035678.1 STAS domain-containing protein [Pseudomonadota bacterium]
MKKRSHPAKASEPVKLRLDPLLDIKAAAPLYALLRGQRGHDLVIDASAVERIGGQCLQVLLAARASWAADQHGFLVEGFSPGVIATLELMGIEPAAFDHRREIRA